MSIPSGEGESNDLANAFCTSCYAALFFFEYIVAPLTIHKDSEDCNRSDRLHTPTYEGVIHQLPSPSINLLDLHLKPSVVFASTTCLLYLFRASATVFMNQALSIFFLCLTLCCLFAWVSAFAHSSFSINTDVSRSCWLPHTFFSLIRRKFGKFFGKVGSESLG